LASKIKVLIVDDDEGLIEILHDELQSEGYDVLTATNGDAGMEAFRSQRPSLVVLDIKMPGLGGKQVLRNMKKEYPSVKVVMLTAHGDIGSASECRALGADDFVEKPYELGDLLASLRYVLEGGHT
jgi:DNA-binding response OmpR family regulator